jgi:ribosomal protein S18 acetylase RimI-like enzyme
MVRQPTSYNQVDDDLFVDIRALMPGELRAAATILAHGVRDNPLHVRVFGSDPDRGQRRLLGFLGHLVAYIQPNGTVLGAYVNGELIGVLGMIKPGRCRPALMETLRFARAIMAGNPPSGVLRIRSWLAAWARIDPSSPHGHIGPLAVHLQYRRRGIGRRLMTRCCERMDALAATAYLETDLAINVAFYETFGFVVTKYEFVLGVPNWFMSRPPTYSAAADATARSGT